MTILMRCLVLLLHVINILTFTAHHNLRRHQIVLRIKERSTETFDASPYESSTNVKHSNRARRFDLSNFNITNEVQPRAKQSSASKRKTLESQHTHPVVGTKGRAVNDTSQTIARIKPSKRPDIVTQLHYARNGHAVIRQLLSPDLLGLIRKMMVQYGQEQELAAWRQKVYVTADRDPVKAQQIVESSCHTIADCQKQLRRLLRIDHVSLPFLQYFNTWRVHPPIFDIAKSLAEVAAILMDVPSVRLYQDAIFWKRVGDGPTPWHTDARMAPFDTSHIITIWIPLQPVHSSGLIFCSKSHNDFALPYWNDVTLSETDPSSPWNQLEQRYKSVLCDYMPLALGDVTVHSGWTLHCADAYEPSPEYDSGDKQTIYHDRMALAITYVDATAPVRDPNNKNDCKKCDTEDKWSYQDWIHDVPYNNKKWNHPLVPVVWPPTTLTTTNTKRMQKKGRKP